MSEKCTIAYVRALVLMIPIRHQTILHLGTLEDLPETDQKKALATRIDELVRQSYTGKQSLFVSPDAVIESLAQKFFTIIKETHTP